MTQKKGVICCGLAVTDMFLHTEIAAKGKLSIVKKISYLAGGPVSNTGIALALLGIPVEAITLIGSDEVGQRILSDLGKNKVGISSVAKTNEVASSLSTLIISSDGERTIYFFPGPNDIFCSKHIDYEKVSSARFFHFGYPPILKKSQYEELGIIMRKAKERGVITCLDTSWDPDVEDHPKKLGPAYPYTDIFAPNIEEASALCGKFRMLQDRADKLGKTPEGKDANVSDVVSPEELEEMGRFFLGKGIKMMIITLGPNGAYIITADKNELGKLPIDPKLALLWADKKMWLPTYNEAGPLNATAAGDSFYAGFMCGLYNEMPIDECLKIGHATAARRVDGSGWTDFEGTKKTMKERSFKKPFNKTLMEMTPDLKY